MKLRILASKLLYGYILRSLQCGLISYIQSIKEDLNDAPKIAMAVSRGKSLIELCKQVTNIREKANQIISLIEF